VLRLQELMLATQIDGFLSEYQPVSHTIIERTSGVRRVSDAV
jgi:hypothetical protein